MDELNGPSRWAVMLAPVDWDGRHSNSPTVLHSTEGAARTEAERLCLTTGKRFVLLRAVAHVHPASPVWEMGTPPEDLDLPF